LPRPCILLKSCRIPQSPENNQNKIQKSSVLEPPWPSRAADVGTQISFFFRVFWNMPDHNTYVLRPASELPGIRDSQARDQLLGKLEGGLYNEDKPR